MKLRLILLDPDRLFHFLNRFGNFIFFHVQFRQLAVRFVKIGIRPGSHFKGGDAVFPRPFIQFQDSQLIKCLRILWVLIDNRLVNIGCFLELAFTGIHFGELDAIGVFLRLEVEGALKLSQSLIPFLLLQIDFTEPGINVGIVARNLQSLQKLPFGI